MKNVKIMSGVSGSGKSTYAKKLISDLPSDRFGCIVSADNFFMRNGTYQFDASLLSLAHGTCFRQFILAMTDEIAPYDLIVVDNTGTSTDELSPYILGAKAFNYDAEIITVNVARNDLHKCAERNAHGAPINVIQSQADRIANRKLPRYWKSAVIPATF